MLSFSPDIDNTAPGKFEVLQKSTTSSPPRPGSSEERLSNLKGAQRSSTSPNASKASNARASPALTGVPSFTSSSEHDEQKDLRPGATDAEEEQEELQASAQIASWPHSHVQESDVGALAEEVATPTPEIAFPGAFPSTPIVEVMTRKRDDSSAASSTSTGSRSGELDSNRSRAGSQASNATHSSVRQMTSGDSLSSNSSSAFSGRPWSTVNKAPLPPLPNAQNSRLDQQNATAPLGKSGLITRSAVEGNRSARSASLMGPQTAPVKAGLASIAVSSRNSSLVSRSDKSSHLVNPSTMHGTISQGRKSPYLPEDYAATANAQGSSEAAPPIAASRSSVENDSALVDDTGRTLTPGLQNDQSVTGSLPTRLRTLSQPGGKRPILSTYNSEVVAVPTPPLPAGPSVQRSDSDPTAVYPTTSLLQSTLDRKSSSPSSQVTYQQLASRHATSSIAGNSSFFEPQTPASTIFSVQLPSLLAQEDSAILQQEYLSPPRNVLRRPFHFLRQLGQSMQSGGFVTPHLYIPKQMWTQNGIKLIHLEAKVRMVNLVISGLETIERTGDTLIAGSSAVGPGNRADAGNKLLREMNSLDGMLDEVQSTLSKKLGFIDAPDGKKGGQVNTTVGFPSVRAYILGLHQNSFTAWGSKLSRSMDKMTKTKK